MDRFPIIITFGAGLLGWLAGGMIVDDPAIAESLQAMFGDIRLLAEIIGVTIVIALGIYLKRKKSHQSE